MIAMALLAALALGAHGDIYRCVAADGSIGFHDKPCKAGSSVLVGQKSETPQADLRRLRVALSKLERVEPDNRKPAPVIETLPRSLGWQSLGPANEALLAACSAQFFECAQANAVRMDRCVATLPRCGKRRSSGCCPEACVSRYGDLRGRGLAPAASVRNALFDDTYGSCSAR